MHAAVIVFPGSNCDRDLAVAFKAVGAKVSMVWHKDTSLPEGVDIVGVPGGFPMATICAAVPLRQTLRSVARWRPMRSVAVMSWGSATAFRC